MMIKLLLGMLVLFSSVSYTKIYQDIESMLPIERSVLAQSMQEVAQLYDELGNSAKARQFYAVALQIYPIGDNAHIIAGKLNKPLDDEQTFNYFEQEGIRLFENNQYYQSLQSFMMALQIKATLPLYQSIADVHRALGNEKKALSYEQLSKGIMGDSL
ncbi:MAG: hypothetical protein ACRCVW_01640 [Brevinema sp.]